MTDGTPAKLDRTSRLVIIRFALKLVTALVAAHLLIDERGYATIAAAWLSFYAVFAVVGAVLVKDAIGARSFNYWDEASWLLLAASLMHMLSRLIA